MELRGDCYVFQSSGMHSGYDGGGHTSLQRAAGEEWVLRALRPLLPLGCHRGLKQPWTKHTRTGIPRNPTSHRVFPLPVSPWHRFLVRRKPFSASTLRKERRTGGPCGLKQAVPPPVCWLHECLSLRFAAPARQNEDGQRFGVSKGPADF